MSDFRNRSWLGYFKKVDGEHEPTTKDAEAQDEQHEIDEDGAHSDDDEKTITGRPATDDELIEVSDESEEEADEEDSAESVSNDSNDSDEDSDDEDYDSKRRWLDLDSRLSKLEHIFTLISKQYSDQGTRHVYR